MSNNRLRAVYLTVEQLWRLAHSLRPVEDAFGGSTAYLVGSVLERQDWRDVDVRIILPDIDYNRIFVPDPNRDLSDQFRMLMQTSISHMLSSQTLLPIDFQIQSQSNMTEEEQRRPRNPAGYCRPYVDSDFVPQWRR